MFRHAGSFKPTTICPQCKARAEYQKDAVHPPIYNHVYRCRKCGANIASPTEYGTCSRYGMIAKDLSANDCMMCPVPRQERFDPNILECRYFGGPMSHPEVQAHFEQKIAASAVETFKMDKKKEVEEYGKKPIEG
jgi:ribosomal protein L37AE/L43A